MAGKRSYGDPCGIARALDVVGERWALLVVRELLLGPKRFTDLRDGLPNLGPDVLSQRLRDLEAAGLASRRRLAPPAGSQVYELTGRGRALEPVLLALGRWGSAEGFPESAHGLGVDATAIGLKTMFDRAAVDGFAGTFELRLHEQLFSARVSADGLELTRGAANDPDAALSTDPPTLANLVWHGLSLSDAERAGAARVEGDRRALRRFLKLFQAS